MVPCWPLVEMAQILYELRRRANPKGLEQSSTITVEKARLIWFEATKQIRRQSEIEKQFETRGDTVGNLVKIRSELLSKIETESANLTAALGLLRADQFRYRELCEEVREFVDAKGHARASLGRREGKSRGTRVLVELDGFHLFEHANPVAHRTLGESEFRSRRSWRASQGT